MCLKKEKLIIVVGAGASIPFGNFSCLDIDTMFKAQGFNQLNTLPKNKNLYEYCSDEINKFIAGRTFFGKPQTSKKTTNFEQVIYEMLNIYALTQEARNRTTGAFFDTKQFPEKIDVLTGTPKKIDPYDFVYESEHLINLLAKEMRKRNLKFNAHPLFQNFQVLCSLLKKKYDIGVINFNYDDIFEEGFSFTLNTGFNQNGTFEPMKIVKGGWNFLYYVHGSLHFDIDLYDNVDAYHYEKDLGNLITKSPIIPTSAKTIEGFPILHTPIIVGYGKAYQTQRNPYSLYVNDFAKKIFEADKILFIGYGFNDIYINNMISLSMNFNRKRKVVVVDYAATNEPKDCIHIGHYENLYRTIPFDAMDFRPTDVHAIDFDRSNKADRPLSVSFRGFDYFINNPEKLLNELK